MKRSNPGAIVAAGLLAGLWPVPASAHLVGIAFGPFYAGALHVLVSAVTLAGLVALAAIAGSQNRAIGRWVLLATPPATLAGALVGAWLPVGSAVLTVEIAAAVALGALAALALPLRPWTMAPVGIAAGLAFGAANGTAGAATDPWLFGIGAALSAALVLILTTAILRRANDAWTPMLLGCRVLGGWAAAIGAIALGGRAAGIA